MNRTVLGLCLTTVIFSGSMTVGAASLGMSAAVPVNAPNYSREVAVLKEAYDTLEKADHDYKGHRWRAMKHIEKACDLLGSPIKGDGKGRQPQPVSDTELREAQGKVEAVRHHIAGGQPAIATELDAAIKEISTALTVK
jgi:hypothetical protein